MGVYHLRSSHVSLIARVSTKYSVRGGAGVLFLFLTLITGLVIASIAVSPVEIIEKENQRQGTDVSAAEVLDSILEKAAPMISSFTGADAEEIAYLTRTKPVIVSAILVILMFFVPGLVTFGGFNQTAGDIGQKGLRYLLFRTERANIFIGRFLGTLIFTELTLLLLMTIVGVYIAAKVPFYPTGDVLLWSLQGFLAIGLFALPYVAFCAWVSASTDSAGVAIIATQVVWFLPLLIWVGTKINAAAAYAGYVTPWPFKYWLVSPHPGQLVGGVAIMLGFSALFVTLGLRTFQKRDL